MGAKVVAVADVATAMAEQRPYRDPCAQKQVLGTLDDMACAGLLEGRVVAALADNYANIMGAAAEAQSADQRRFTSRYVAIA